jgi:hypothetical protein
MDKPIKFIFNDMITTEILPNNKIKFSQSCSSDVKLGYIIVTDKEYELIKKYCIEHGIIIEGFENE